MYKIRITEEKKLIRVELSGQVHLSNIFGIQQFLFHDPSYRKRLAVLLDFSAAEVFPEERGKDVLKLAIQSMNKRPFDETARIAFTAGSNYKLATYLETYRLATEEMPYMIRIFENAEEAETWLTGD
ncbi:MAG: hypothetical protein ACQEQV_00990 [Fibrobacterota bacterium]